MLQKKIKKGYIGIENKAKLFYNSTDISNVIYNNEISSTIQEIDEDPYYRANSSARLGDNAVFTGGYALQNSPVEGLSEGLDLVEMYNDSLTHSYLPNLTMRRITKIGSSEDNTLLWVPPGLQEYNKVKTEGSDIYNKDFTKTYDKNLIGKNLNYYIVSFKNLMGIYSSSSYTTSFPLYKVNNSSLTYFTSISLSQAHYSFGFSSNNNYLIIAGGKYRTYNSNTNTEYLYSTSKVYAINEDGSRVNVDSLCSAREPYVENKFPNIGNKAVIVGGYNRASSKYHNFIDLYDNSLTHSYFTVDILTTGSYRCGLLNINNLCALLSNNFIDIIDSSMTLTRNSYGDDKVFCSGVALNKHIIISSYGFSMKNKIYAISLER